MNANIAKSHITSSRKPLDGVAHAIESGCAMTAASHMNAFRERRGNCESSQIRNGLLT